MGWGCPIVTGFHSPRVCKVGQGCRPQASGPLTGGRNQEACSGFTTVQETVPLSGGGEEEEMGWGGDKLVFLLFSQSF